MKIIKSLEELAVEITGRCPVACSECPYRPAPKAPDRAFPGLFTFLDVHGVDEIERVVFTGGDPLLAYASVGSCMAEMDSRGVKVGSYLINTSGLIVHGSAMKTIVRCILESYEDESNRGCAISIYGGEIIEEELERHGLKDRWCDGSDRLRRIFRDRVRIDTACCRPEKPEPGFLYDGAIPNEYYLSGSGLFIRHTGDVTWGQTPEALNNPEASFDNIEELEGLVDELLKRKELSPDEF